MVCMHEASILVVNTIYAQQICGLLIVSRSQRNIAYLLAKIDYQDGTAGGYE